MKIKEFSKQQTLSRFFIVWISYLLLYIKFCFIFFFKARLLKIILFLWLILEFKLLKNLKPTLQIIVITWPLNDRDIPVTCNGYAKVMNGQKRLGTNILKNGNSSVMVRWQNRNNYCQSIKCQSIRYHDFPHFFRPIHNYTHLIILIDI